MQFVALDLCYFDQLWLLVKNIYILIQHFINGANQKESSLAIANFWSSPSRHSLFVFVHFNQIIFSFVPTISVFCTPSLTKKNIILSKVLSKVLIYEV